MPANAARTPLDRQLIVMPTSPVVQARLHAMGPQADHARFWQMVHAGHAVAVTGNGRDAIWVRDNAAWAAAAARWHDLPIYVAGTLRLVRG